MSIHYADWYPEDLKWLPGKEQLKQGDEICVKVSTKGPFASWQGTNFFQALQDSRLTSDVLNELSKILIGVVVLHTGTSLTIMRKVSWSPVNYETYEEKPHFWDLFQIFVEKILKPLAQAGIVHADLRPGFEQTSNVVIYEEKICLVDFESISIFRTMNKARKKDRRYPVSLHPTSRSTSFDYLLQQCLGMTGAWLLKMKAKEFVMQNALDYWKYKSWMTEPHCSKGFFQKPTFRKFISECKIRAIGKQSPSYTLMDKPNESVQKSRRGNIKRPKKKKRSLDFRIDNIRQ